MSNLKFYFNVIHLVSFTLNVSYFYKILPALTLQISLNPTAFPRATQDLNIVKVRAIYANANRKIKEFSVVQMT